jgi:DNA replicative helicase MCM subunit Mcm2 (Cdc46/Mcm family)
MDKEKQERAKLYLVTGIITVYTLVSPLNKVVTFKCSGKLRNKINGG